MARPFNKKTGVSMMYKKIHERENGKANESLCIKDSFFICVPEETLCKLEMYTIYINLAPLFITHFLSVFYCFSHSKEYN